MVDEKVAMVISSCVVSILAFKAAIVILYVIFCRKNGVLRTPSNLLIANLSLADLLKSVPGTAPMYALRVLGFFTNYHLCLFGQGFFMTGVEVALFTHLALTIERLMAVAYPYTYVRLFGKKMVILMATIAWTLGITLWIILPFLWNKGLDKANYCTWVFIIPKEYIIYINVLVGIFLPLLFIIIAYTQITIIALRHLIRLRKLVHPEPSSEGETATSTPALKKTSAELMTTLRCFIVVIVFIICQLPQRIITLMVVAGHKVSVPSNALVALVNVHSLTNPFLYAYSSKDLRREIIIICKEYCHCRSHRSNPDAATN